ncbi:tyrosine-protein kinase Wzc [Serratia rhizosphaerae]|uniref:Tyrosine-protein kinase Wzc n=1 Tax=Serratia rhizosphaerae TaxID=2597702 RepID=A0ABX6GI59_9GAMM|nr:tyrosine-protein kinase Wzc [Serratia rhizosphaerae]MEB6335169.1 tyrosine-protein kinase Wzc [Serratia rhizosphaerae]QHA85951.1 tyrosine-protein kinase Wzc [Serratia rhizosphaerae]
MADKNRVNVSQNDSSDELDIGRLVGELIDNRWLIIGITAIFLTFGIIYCLFATPIYSANAIVQVEQNVGNKLLSNINQMLPSGQPQSAPEIELLKSRMILGKTVEDLNLTTDIQQDYFPILGRGLARLMHKDPGQLSVSKLTLPKGWDSPSFKLTVDSATDYTISRDGDELFKGKVGVFAQQKGMSILVSDIVAEPGTTFTITSRTYLSAINQLADQYEVVDQGKDTGVLGLTLTGDNPVMIQKILNSITRNYLEQNIERKSEEDAKSLVFLRMQLPKVRASLDNAEDKLSHYRQQKDSVDLTMEAKSILDSIVAVEGQLNELTFKEADISKLYTKEHPAYRSLLEKRKTLEEERDRLNKRVNAMPETQQEVVRLSRDVDSGKEVYMQLLNREQELNISKASTIGNVRIVDRAMTGDSPVQPRKAIIMLLSLVLGGMVSCGYVLARSYLHRGIESPEQLEEMGINVYASVPLSEWQRKRDMELISKIKGRKQNADADSLLAFGNPADLAIEAIRSLRTSLHFAMMEAKNNVLMISGASPGIGKTFISANLAAVVAQTGQRVLLIDSDMRKGYVHELIGADGKQGLSNVLSGKLSINEAVQHTQSNVFDFISRGQIPPNPSELLMHRRFEEVLKWASENYDLVLVDTPPILAVTDAAIIGKHAGTSLLVARFELNSPKEVEVSIRRFEQNGIEIKGVILNAVVRKLSNYYSYGYDNYSYNYDSEK